MQWLAFWEDLSNSKNCISEMLQMNVFEEILSAGMSVIANPTATEKLLES